MHRPQTRRAGRAGLALLLWAFALALFALPFVRARDGLQSEEGDWSRAEADVPYAVDVADFEAEYGPGLAALLEESTEAYFGLGSPRLRSAGVIETGMLPLGAETYAMHCVGCHGAIGDGAGPAARHLAPRPRNFRAGLYKFTSTPAGMRPLRRDLYQTVTRGLSGSAMMEFRLLPEDVRWSVVEHVRWLALRGEYPRLVLDTAWDDEELPDAETLEELADLAEERWHPALLPTIHPGAPEPPPDAASIARGHALFSDTALANCAACHGPGGRGDGPSATAFLDDWGYPIRPRDLTRGVFRAGSESSDLYRTIAAGIKGTPMGSFEGALTPEQIWDLVHYVQSLAQEQAP